MSEHRIRPGQLVPNELEVAVLAEISKKHPEARLDLSDPHVLSREYTGVGSFTTFVGAPPNWERDRVVIGLDAIIALPTMTNGLGAIIFVCGSRIACLELYSFGTENWDGTFEGFRIENAA